MNKGNITAINDASTKSPHQQVGFQLDLPVLDLILETKAEVEALSAQAGLKIMRYFLEQEIESHCGPHGEQKAYRHGTQSTVEARRSVL